MLPHARLGRRVGVERCVPVLVIRCEVEPHRCLGAEVIEPVESKAAALDGEDVDIGIEHRHQRNFRVADGRRPVTGGSEHLGGQQRRGRLAVGTGDRQHRPRTAHPLLLPLVGEVDLRADRPTCTYGGDDHRMRLGHAGRRADDVDGLDQPTQRVTFRPLDQGGAEPGGNAALVVVGRGSTRSAGDHVVGEHHLVPAPLQGCRQRFAGDGDSVDEGATRHVRRRPW